MVLAGLSSSAAFASRESAVFSCKCCGGMSGWISYLWVCVCVCFCILCVGCLFSLNKEVAVVLCLLNTICGIKNAPQCPLRPQLFEYSCTPHTNTTRATALQLYYFIKAFRANALSWVDTERNDDLVVFSGQLFRILHNPHFVSVSIVVASFVFAVYVMILALSLSLYVYLCLL